MKKTIETQLKEVIKNLTKLENRIDKLESVGSLIIPAERAIAYSFTEEEFGEFLKNYTDNIKSEIFDKISDMGMEDNENLYEVETKDNFIIINVQSDAVSNFISNTIEDFDMDDLVSNAHLVMDDLDIEYTIH